MGELRVREVAEAKGLSLSQFYQEMAVARSRRGEPLAINTVRRYWYSTRDGSTGGDPLEQVSLPFLREIARVLGVGVCELLTPEDDLGNVWPAPHRHLYAMV
jgi:hypothetical protein